MELISIWREPEIVEKIEARTTNKKLVWEEVAVRLHDIGFPARTGAQVYHKVKDLKRQFKVIHDKAGKSGAGKVDLVKFPYYHQLNEIMGKRHAIDPPAGYVGESAPKEGSDHDDDDDDVDGDHHQGKN